MFQLGKTIISEDILDKEFVCNLNACKGACCVEGEAGAPLTKEEGELLKEIYTKIKPYLRQEGIAAIEEQGFYTINPIGEFETTLIEGRECAYAIFEENGIAKCAIEKAHKDIHEKTKFRFEWEPVKAGRSVEAIRFLFAPGRKAIAEAETKKAKEEKRRRLDNQRFLSAIECAKAKKGECDIQDNKRIVCKLCVAKGFCADIRRRGGKPFDPTKG